MNFFILLNVYSYGIRSWNLTGKDQVQKFSEGLIDLSETREARLPNQSSWRSRGYLPHFDGGPIPQSITFRLIDSLPIARMREWAAELPELPVRQAENERRRRIEEYLDQGIGELWLSHPSVAELVEQALLHFDAQRYCLHAWVVMPNHVHVLITPRPGHDLSQILHSWKSFTAKKANALLGKTGAFWQQEYFDRFVRNEKHFEDALNYIEPNPVKAGLCDDPKDWRFSSAAWRRSPKEQECR